MIHNTRASIPSVYNEENDHSTSHTIYHSQRDQDSIQLVDNDGHGMENAEICLQQNVSSDSLSIRISNACQRQFQDEPWYLDHQFLILAIVIGCGSIIVGFTPSTNAFLGILLSALIFLVFLCLLPISFCGIINYVEHRTTPLSSRNSLSPVRLVVDQRKGYRIFRLIYVLYFPVSAILTAIFFRTVELKKMALITLCLFAPWSIITFHLLLSSVFLVFPFVFGRLLSENRNC